MWCVFADADALKAVIAGLVAPWRAAGVTRVVGIEPRGFLLGAACALQQCERSGAHVLGISLIVDQLSPDALAGLRRVTALFSGADLGPPFGG